MTNHAELLKELRKGNPDPDKAYELAEELVNKFADIRAQVEKWRDEAQVLIDSTPSGKDATHEQTLLYAVTNGYRDCLILIIDLIDRKDVR